MLAPNFRAITPALLDRCESKTGHDCCDGRAVRRGIAARDVIGCAAKGTVAGLARNIGRCAYDERIVIRAAGVEPQSAEHVSALSSGADPGI